MYDVVGLDMPNLDLNVNVRDFPVANQGESIQQLSWQGGGKVSSGMVAAARLGAKCAMMGAVGDDLFGRFCIGDFQRHGIDTSGMVIRKEATTALSVVLSDYASGGRSILVKGGTTKPYQFEELSTGLLRSCRYLFICHANETVVKAVDVAREAGAKVLIDADDYSDAIMELLPKIDVFVASEFFYDALFQDGDREANCRRIMERGPEIVVFTLGEKGCVGLSSEGFFSIPAYPITVADTVGAGDVYHGAFAAGLLSGRSVEETARFASAVSAIKCTRIGGRAGIPDRAVTERFMAEGVIDYTEIDQRVEFYQRGLERVTGQEMIQP